MKKPLQIRFHLKRPHTITKINDGKKIDSTNTGSMNARSKLTTNQEGKLYWFKTITFGIK